MHRRPSSPPPDDSASQNIMAVILRSLPQEAGLTKIDYEGPRIALYSKNPVYLMENHQVVSNMVNTIKKRIVVRTDESIRRPEEESADILQKTIPKEVEVTDIFFDPALGEAVVFAKKPWALAQAAGDDGEFDNVNLVEKTGWKVRIRKTPQSMDTVKPIYEILHLSANDRIKFYKETGEKIFRTRLDDVAEASIVTLGGFAEVGRSAMLLVTHESKVLLDCGINLFAKDSLHSLPRFDIAGLKINEIDAVVLTHAHMDHAGFVPGLFKYGYRGPVYCTDPTLFIMNILQRDYVSREGERALYSPKDIEEVIRHTITLGYGIVTDISPDVKLVLSNSGHMIGASSIHIHIGNGDYNIVYTGDFKFGKSMVLENASWNFPRVETIIIESTFGGKEDIQSSREQADAMLVETINRTIAENGKMLFPVPAAGISQELMAVINHYMKEGRIPKTTRVIVDRIIADVTSIHQVFPEYLSRDFRQSMMTRSGENPFGLDNGFEVSGASPEAGDDKPAIILAPSSMLVGGPSVDYLKQIANDPRSKLVFLSYQAPDTPGRAVQDGVRKVTVAGQEIAINCQVEKLEGFSNHSDYNQLDAYLKRLRPKLRRVLVNHGERAKAQNLASSINRLLKIQTQHPLVQEAIKLL